MPTVTLNRKVFEKLVGKKLPIDILKNRISMLGTDLDLISGEEIQVEVFPDRPDMLSEQGFARAFSSFIGVKKGLRKYDVKDSKEKVRVDNSVKQVRPYTACAIVKGLNFNDEKVREVIQIQEKLHGTYGRNRRKCAIGIYPLEVIVPPIMYKALTPEKIKFIPLEGKKEMTGKEILELHPTGKEHAHLLEGEKKYPLFVDSKGNILSMPPIINSDTVGKITERTKEVFIECSGFDFETLSICLNIIVTTLADMGGEIYSMDLEYSEGKKKTPDLSPKKIKITVDYVNKLLGVGLKEKEMVSFLERMGYGWEKGKVLIPSYRADILHPVDLVEDIAIAYGYENFVPEIPQVSTIACEDDFEVFKKRIVNLLVGHGFLELNTYHITNEENQRTKMNCGVSVIKLANALNIDYDILRSWMIPSLLEILSRNKHNDYPQKICDIGTVFKKGKSETGVIEHQRLGVAICEDKVDYTGIRQILESLFDHLGVKYEFRTTEHGSFIPGRVARVSVKGKDVAYIGEIHPSVLANWDLTMPVASFELNLSELYEVINK